MADREKTTSETDRRGPPAWRWHGIDGPGTGGTTVMNLLGSSFQAVVGAVFVILAWVTVQPIGLTGRGLVGLILLTICSVVMALRPLSPDRLPPPARFCALMLGVIAGGMLYGFDPNSAGPVIVFVLAGHAGFALPNRAALVVAATASIATAGALAVEASGALWWTGLLTGLTVLIGMSRRNHAQALRLAEEKVAQTERAAESEARERELAERARVARDIHDVLAHSLSGVNMQLSLADALLEKGQTAQSHQAVKTAQEMVVSGLAEARKAVYALRDDTIEVVPAIRAMLQGDNETVITTGQPTRFDAATVSAVVRVVGESLTNARRHAPGAAVTVAVRYRDNGVTVDVRNDEPTGRAGMPSATAVGSGLGLIGMRERAAEIGATITAGPTSDGGWNVHMEVDR